MPNTYSKFRLFLGGLLLLLSSSCSYRYYVPSSTTLVNLTEQGDLKIIGGLGPNGIQSLSWGGTLAYSPLSSLGILANYSGVKPAPNRPATGGYSAEVAVGTYLSPFGRKEQFNLDLYAGYGIGHIYNRYFTSGVSRFDFRKYYIQTGLHIQKNRLLTYSTGLSVGNVNYTAGFISDDIPNREMSTILRLQALRNLLLLEWKNRIEIGRNPIKFYGEFVLSNSSETGKSFSIPFVMSFGATLSLSH